MVLDIESMYLLKARNLNNQCSCNMPNFFRLCFSSQHTYHFLQEEKAQQSNLTVAVSFGLEREAAFEHAKTKTIVSMAAPNGSAYVFARDINVLWRHGILQMPPEKRKDEGRISVIAWGWVEQEEA